ncbi:UDP-glycosyltransferase 83A1-like [Euphorbia lathyris]|uniref:UDP-glycosyltransferase 83A1-like n=1 Tax=Euphorbia lathyris TaxID=212925 RepID=UPI003313D1B7
MQLINKSRFSDTEKLETTNMSRPHILAIPYPAQGHVLPLMELSQCLAKHGFRITFVNTDYIHEKVLNALPEKYCIEDHINLVSIPDGLEPWEDRNELGKLTESLFTFVPGKLEELIHKMNASEDDKISCVITDQNNGWAVDVATKMNIRCATFWPAAAASLTLLFEVPKLIDDGIIDNDGTPLKNQNIQLAPEMPVFSTEKFLLTCKGDEIMGRIFFDVVEKNIKAAKLADWVICNSAYDLEPGAFTLAPKILPIGPLLASSRNGNSAGCFWKEDTNCLKWLDQQPPNSVIYVAFGSITIFNNTQFQELALGLELTGKPFLWVVRPGLTKETNVYPQGYEERVGTHGKIVEWAPQQKVLSHPSVGCFMSHCGWNSTMEGVANGVPFLCWPYFSDQHTNESYICDVWKVGLNFNPNEFGIISREEIKNKVELVLTDKNIRERTEELKEIAKKSVGECGHSKKNFSNFIQGLSI